MRETPVVSTAMLTAGLVLLGSMDLDTPSWLVAIYMALAGVGIGPVNSVSMTAMHNAVPRDVVGVSTANSSMFRQVGGSIGVSTFGALFAVGLVSRLGEVGALTRASGFDVAALASLPADEHQEVLEAFAGVLPPVFFAAAGAAFLAFVLSLLLR